MSLDPREVACPLCRGPANPEVLREASWLAPEIVDRIAARHPGWRRADGGCPACVQQALLEVLLRQGHNAFHRSVQDVWPLDPEAAFGAIPTPLRLHADPRHGGRGVTIAFVDTGFYPHPDLTAARNRIRAWADAAGSEMVALRFSPDKIPRWPGWDRADATQWHGLMTSASAAGDGRLGHGFYRGLAWESDVVLVQVAPPEPGRRSASIARALRWLGENAGDLGVRVVSLSVPGEPVFPLADNEVDRAVSELVAGGVTVVAAAGNDGERRLVPPATSPASITVGGLDDRNSFGHDEWRLWHSSYGETIGRAPKPEVVAPSLRVVAPILPGTPLAAEAGSLFARRGEPEVERRLLELKMVTPHYQHVEGTSFSAPIVASLVACMLEANPDLSPRRVRELLRSSAHPVPGASPERQGAGAVDAGRAVALALADRHSTRADFRESPHVGDGLARFRLHDHEARRVEVLGGWNRWGAPGQLAAQIEPGLWEACLPLPPPGAHPYKFLLDGGRWLVDPANPTRVADERGNWNSLLIVPVSG